MITKSPIKCFCNFGAFLCLAALCLAWKTSHPLTPAEEKIIGTWQFSGVDTTGRVVFRRDHTVVELFREDEIVPKWVAGAAGKWRLEGNEIIAEKEILPIEGMTPFPRRITRTAIREFHEDRLVRGDGRSDLIRVAPDSQLYIRSVVLICIILILAACFMAVRTVRNSSFRQDFIWLAVAGCFALLWCGLRLIGDLAEAGKLIVSVMSVRSLQLATQILGVACLLLLAAGFSKLAFSFALIRKQKIPLGR